MEKLNQMDTDGVNFRHQKQKEKARKFSYEEAKKKKEAKQHSKKAQVYRANEGEAPGKKKSRLKFGLVLTVKTYNYEKVICCSSIGNGIRNISSIRRQLYGGLCDRNYDK